MEYRIAWKNKESSDGRGHGPWLECDADKALRIAVRLDNKHPFRIHWVEPKH